MFGPGGSKYSRDSNLKDRTLLLYRPWISVPVLVTKSSVHQVSKGLTPTQDFE